MAGKGRFLVAFRLSTSNHSQATMMTMDEKQITINIYHQNKKRITGN
jgi:hypothetical protein